MTRSVVLVLSTGLVFTTSTSAAAQVHQGASGMPRRASRVRVTTPALRPQRQVWLFEELKGDSLILRRLTGNIVDGVPLLWVSRIDTSMGTARRPLYQSIMWGVAGIGAGALLGHMIGVAAFENTPGGCGMFETFGCHRESEAAGVLGVVGGLFGATIGFRVSHRPRERWQRIRLP